MPLASVRSRRPVPGALVLAVALTACSRGAAPTVPASEPIVLTPARDPEPPTDPIAQQQAPPRPTVTPSLEQGLGALDAGDLARALIHCKGVLDGELQGDPREQALNCAVVAQLGIEPYAASGLWLSECDDADEGQCLYAMGMMLHSKGHLRHAMDALTGAIIVVEDDATAEAAEATLMEIHRTLEPEVKRRHTEAAMTISGGDYENAKALSLRAFGSQLAKAPSLEALVHPDWGVVVLHNIPGHITHTVVEPAWPKGEHDYLDLFVEDPWPRIRKVARRGRKVRNLGEDEAGCEVIRAGLARGATALLVWNERFQIDTQPWWFWQELWMPSYEQRAEMLEDIMTREQFEAVRRAALTMTHEVYLDGHVLGFARIDGQWRLLAVDMTDDFCG